MIVEATIEHARLIAPRLRSEDVRDILRAGRELDDAMAHTLAHSPYRRAWLILGEVACLWGVGVTDRGRAMPWLWATDLVERHRFAFIRLYREEIPRIMAEFPMVETVIDERYRGYLKWLRRIGVSVAEPQWNPAVGSRVSYVSLRA